MPNMHPRTLGPLVRSTLPALALGLTVLPLSGPLSGALAAEDGGAVPPRQATEDTPTLGDKIAETAKHAGETIKEVAHDAVTEAGEAAREARGTLSRIVEDTAGSPPPDQLAAVDLPGPLHEVTEGLPYSYTKSWTGPTVMPAEIIDMRIKNGEEALADVDGVLANDDGEIVAVIADPEGFMNLNLGTQNVVLPLDRITYEPSQDAFQTDLSADALRALPAWTE